MADGLMYPTGISSQPIDFTSGAQAFMRSAIESRLDEIESSQEQISENKKNVLKAMSIRALPELANAQRDRYQKEIEDYRQSVVDKFKSSGGKLSLQQQREIQDGFMDMEGRMKNELTELNQFKKLQDNMTDPNFQYAYDPDKYAEILGGARQRLMRGEGLGNVNAQLAQAQLPATLGDYVDKRYGSTIDRMDIAAKGRWVNDNTFEFTSQEDEDEFNRNIDDYINNDPRFRKEAQQVGYDRTRERLRDLFIKKTTKVEPKRRYTGTSGTSRELRALSPKKVELASGEYTDYVDYPASQAEKRFTINRAVNEETGREDTFGTAQSMRVIGFAPKENKVFFVSEGGQLKRGGKPVLGIEGFVSDEDKIETKKKSGITLDEVTADNQQIFTQLAKNSKFGDSDKATRITNVDVVDNGDGTYTVKGKVEKWVDKGVLGTGIAKSMVKKDNLDTKKHKLEDSEEVSITLNTLTDPKETTRYSAPLSEYEEVVSELYQYGIDGQKVSDYFKGQKGKTETGSVSYVVDGTTYNIPSDKEKAFLAKFPNAKRQ